MKLSLIVCGLWVAGALFASAATQTVPPPAPARAVCELPGVRPGTTVRVHSQLQQSFVPAPRGSTIGPVVRCDGGDLVLGPFLGQESPEYIVPGASIDRLWTRGHRGLLGAVTGVVGGAALGGGLAAARSNLCTPSPQYPDGNCPGNVASGAVIGGVVGGVVGWAIGSELTRWVQRYP
jgi:hypothetical protein